MGMGAERFIAALPATFLLLIAGIANLRADEFRTPAISTVRVEWRAAIDQLRSEIGVQSPTGPAFTFARRRQRSAFDPRSMPAKTRDVSAFSCTSAGVDLASNAGS